MLMQLLKSGSIALAASAMELLCECFRVTGDFAMVSFKFEGDNLRLVRELIRRKLRLSSLPFRINLEATEESSSASTRSLGGIKRRPDSPGFAPGFDCSD